jgi:hypothetical protein
MFDVSLTFLELVSLLSPLTREEEPFLSVIPAILGPLVSSVESLLLISAPVSLAVEFMLYLLPSISFERSCSLRPNTFFVIVGYSLSPPVWAALLVLRLMMPSPSGLKFDPEFLIRLGSMDYLFGESLAGETFLNLWIEAWWSEIERSWSVSSANSS